MAQYSSSNRKLEKLNLQTEKVRQELIAKNQNRDLITHQLKFSIPVNRDLKVPLDLSIDFATITKDSQFPKKLYMLWDITFEQVDPLFIYFITFLKTQIIYRVGNVENSDLDELNLHPTSQTDFVSSSLSFINESIEIIDIPSSSNKKVVFHKALYISEPTFITFPDFQVKLDASLILPANNL